MDGGREGWEGKEGMGKEEIIRLRCVVCGVVSVNVCACVCMFVLCVLFLCVMAVWRVRCVVCVCVCVSSKREFSNTFGVVGVVGVVSLCVCACGFVCVQTHMLGNNVEC